MSLLLF